MLELEISGLTYEQISYRLNYINFSFNKINKENSFLSKKLISPSGISTTLPSIWITNTNIPTSTDLTFGETINSVKPTTPIVHCIEVNNKDFEVKVNYINGKLPCSHGQITLFDSLLCCKSDDIYIYIPYSESFIHTQNWWYGYSSPGKMKTFPVRDYLQGGRSIYALGSSVRCKCSPQLLQKYLGGEINV